MSFKVRYEHVPTKTYLFLTAIVGRNGQLYWLKKSVAFLFDDTTSAFLNNNNAVRVKNVTGLDGCSPAIHDELLQEQVISHAELCKKFKKSKDKAVIKFGKRLNNKRTLIECVVEESTAQLSRPTLLKILKEKMEKKTLPNSITQLEAFLKDSNSSPLSFFAWLGCFKDRVQEDLYQLERDALIEMIRKDFVFPEYVTIKNGNRQVRYVRE